MVKLPCPARDCAYETIEQETRPHAKELLDIHVRIDHAAAAVAGGDSLKKPEKFPRPEISLDKSTEDQSEFLVTWEQYKDEYGPEIKEDILSLEERTLDETVKTIEAKESGKLARQMVGAGAAPGKVFVLKPGPRMIPIPPNISDPVANASTQVSLAKS